MTVDAGFQVLSAIALAAGLLGMWWARRSMEQAIEILSKANRAYANALRERQAAVRMLASARVLNSPSSSTTLRSGHN